LGFQTQDLSVSPLDPFRSIRLLPRSVPCRQLTRFLFSLSPFENGVHRGPRVGTQIGVPATSSAVTPAIADGCTSSGAPLVLASKLTPSCTCVGFEPGMTTTGTRLTCLHLRPRLQLVGHRSTALDHPVVLGASDARPVDMSHHFISRQVR
jgi:hypothetical protein